MVRLMLRELIRLREAARKAAAQGGLNGGDAELSEELRQLAPRLLPNSVRRRCLPE